MNMESSLNRFGGKWTEQKINIFTKYLKAYLDIMAKYHFELIYFDGFAGCGEIEAGTQYETLLEGVATKVVDLDHPKKFDLYYLVDLHIAKANALRIRLNERHPELKSKIYVVSDDCNEKLVRLAEYVAKENQKRRALAFIDPFGMQVDWKSIASMKGLGIDMWLLVPTSAVNRMLKRDGEIDKSWMDKLIRFLGLPENEIRKLFYVEHQQVSLFGGVDNVIAKKSERIFDNIISCYRDQLSNIWNHVSRPLPLKNSKGAIIFHFIFASQNASAQKIANAIIGKELNI